jgi:hypothetical protein
VRTLPPALRILALAVSVNLRAATVILGRSKSLTSSVTVPTMTTVLSFFSPRCLTSLDKEIGGLLTLDEINLLNTVLLNAESVLLAKNLKSYSIPTLIPTNELQVKYYSDKQMKIKVS